MDKLILDKMILDEMLFFHNDFIMLPNSNTLYTFILHRIKTWYLYLILTSFFHRVIRKYPGNVLNGWQLAKMKKSIPDMSLP